MKLKYTAILSAATLIVAAANANAGVAFDLYAGATAGFGRQIVHVDNADTLKGSARSFGAVAGIDIPFIRLEAEYDYLDATLKHHSSETYDSGISIGMLNAYVKTPGLGVIMPYIGGGIGVVWNVDIQDMPLKYKESSKPVYQGMLGMTLNIPALPFKIDLEGRLLYTSKLIDIAAINTSASATHYDARVKLRYIF